MHNAKRFRAARKLGFRSGLEHKISEYLTGLKVTFDYESVKIEWEDLAYRTYTPDFVLSNGIIIETKGIFDSEDRRKHLEVRKQHPELDIRFVFSNSMAKLYKGSKTRYCNWCDKNGFIWAHRVIPEEWLKEKGRVIKAKTITLKEKIKK